MTDLETLAEIRRVAAIMDVEIIADATRLDTLPFTPRGIGEALGAELATVHTLAAMVGQLADIVERLVTR